MRLGALLSFVAMLALTAAIAVPAGAQGPDPGGASAPSSNPAPSGAGAGGSGYATAGLPQLTVPGTQAKLVHGLAAAPAAAPLAVKRAIWAANEIVGLPYDYGGGHKLYGHSAALAAGYDCSGTVSFALHGARLLSQPLDSTEFETWGLPGAGPWITVYASSFHAYAVIAGLRLDTSSADDPHGGQGPRWRRPRRSNAGYVVRHALV